MRRFRWRLQRVLEIKTQEEQLRRAELLKLTEKLAERRGRLLAEKRKLEEIIAAIAAEVPGKRVPKQAFFLRHSAASDEQIKKLEKQIRDLELQQQQKAEELVQIRRFKESLERLRQAAFKEFIEQQEKLEQKELDQISQVRFACSTGEWFERRGRTAISREADQ